MLKIVGDTHECEATSEAVIMRAQRMADTTKAFWKKLKNEAIKKADKK